jgi:hypothetical protein
VTTQPGNPFAKPTPAVGGGESYPANFQLVGRLLIFWPLTFTEHVKSTLKDSDDNDVYQDIIVADTAMLDGEPLMAKVDYATRQPKEPFPFPITAPMEFTGMTWSQTQVVKGLRAMVGTGQPVLARLIYGVKGRNGFTPMKLQDPTPEEVQQGMQYLANRDQIKAYWAQKFAAAGVQAHQPAPPAQAGNPFGAPVQQNQPWNPYNAQQQQAPAVPQWNPAMGQQNQPAPTWGPEVQGQAGPVSQNNQPWNPYNGPDNGPGTPQPGTSPVDDPWAGTPANWNQSTPEQHQAWTPQPEGPPAGWPGSNQ